MMTLAPGPLTHPMRRAMTAPATPVDPPRELTPVAATAPLSWRIRLGVASGAEGPAAAGGCA